MKEFMLLIRTEGDYCAGMAPEVYQEHIRKVSNYIAKLMQDGKLKSAQPLDMDGAMLQGNNGVFKDGPFIESKEMIVGYYHILAMDLEEAKEIAKSNPIFQDTAARIEIRPIKIDPGIILAGTVD
ncbi:MAG TPA: YciI family protein [Puia sp.]|nr:YciI family protein [Puia sp.]